MDLAITLFAILAKGINADRRNTYSSPEQKRYRGDVAHKDAN